MSTAQAGTGSAGKATPVSWHLAPWRLARLVVSILTTRQRRAVAYRDLMSLDAHMLRDLGLSHRAAAERPYDRFMR